MANFLQLKELRIKNYKSIIDETIKLDGYGLYVFTGKNGTGKSNVIKAFNSITKNLSKEELKKVSYKNYVNKNDIENNDVEVNYSFEINEGFKSVLKEAGRVDNKILDNLKVKYFSFTRFINKEMNDFSKINLAETFKNSMINDDFINYEVFYNSTRNYNYSAGDRMINTITYSSIGLKKFKEYLFDVLYNSSPNSFSWNYNDCESLFFHDVDLNIYIENNNSNIYFQGLLRKVNSNLDIKQVIRDDNGKRRFVKELDNIINDYINKTWQTSKLSIESKITDDNVLKFYILDNDILLNKQTEVSSGSKLMLSLLTSIFMSDSENIEQNNIIVIDEPELHLHPSAVREMRKLLLDLSKNNYIIISTHSPYMIDYDNLEENIHYYLVDKTEEKGTFIERLEDKHFSDNELFESAFGISFMSDLLASKILIVEGETDVKIFRKYFENKGIQVLGGEGKQVNKWIDFILGRVNGNSKVISLFDADGAGKNYLKRNKELKNIDCYTLTDIDRSLLPESELEDLYDLDYIKEEFKIVDSSYKYEDSKTVWDNLKLSGHCNLKKELKDKWNEYFLIIKNDKNRKIRNFVKELESKFK